MRLGILGSGQLSQMLASAGRKHGHDVYVYTNEQEALAHAVADHLRFGRLDDKTALRQFFSLVDAVIFENEFIDHEAIATAAADTGTVFFPSTDTVFRLSDKIAQKDILTTLGIPTAAGHVIKTPLTLRSLQEIVAAKKYRAVLKWSRFGYDGKGVFIVRDQLSFNLNDAFAFCNEAFVRSAPILVEDLVVFSHELAMVAVRGRSGDFAHYPLVISRQERGVCKDVIGPATALLMLHEVEKSAAQHMRRFAEHMNMVGAFAFEFFYIDEGRILVNEIAPRVHNSAHYTLDACTQSQFDNHIRAITDEPLDTKLTTNFFAMRNLLGPARFARTINVPSPAPQPLHLYWYHKKETRPFRKLGHVTICAPDRDVLDELIATMRDYDARFLTELLTNKDVL